MLDIRPPAEEYRRLVQARMETLAKLGDAAGDGAARLDDYAEALKLGFAAIEEAAR
jgi:hypothetical protein